MDRVQTMTYPDTEVVTTTYNSQGLVESVVGGSTYVQATDYDPLGRVEARTLGADVLRQDAVYYPWTTANGRGRLKQIKTGTSSHPTSLQDLRYSYDAVGNVLRIEDWKAGAPQTQSFGYDALDRLTTAATSGGGGGSYNESYSYDRAGNLTSKTGVGSYAYGASASGCQSNTPTSKPHAVTGAGNFSFSYDCNGNITQRNVGGSYTLSYDAENRLTSVSGAASASFVYDGDGNRVKAVLGSTTTYYVGNDYEKEGSVIRKYYYANGQRVAMRDGGTVYFLLTDHLGSTAVTADSNGDRTAELWYKPWGEYRGTPYGTTPTTYRFTGQREDATIGLYFYNARYYDPTLGRFTQPDAAPSRPPSQAGEEVFSCARARPPNLVGG